MICLSVFLCINTKCLTYYCQFYEVRNVKSGHIAGGGCNRGADNFGGKDFVFRSVKRLTFKQTWNQLQPHISRDNVAIGLLKTYYELK